MTLDIAHEVDADATIDRATFDQPPDMPVDIREVVVNGTPVAIAGGHTGANPDRVVRRSER